MKDHRLKLLIRADAGPNVGTRHVMRMIALGQAWKKLHGCVAFVCGDLPSGLIKRITSEGFQYFRLENDQVDSSDAQETATIATQFAPDWIALDGHQFDDQYQRQLSETPARLMVLDDFRNAEHRYADLVLNQNATLTKTFQFGPKPRRPAHRLSESAGPGTQLVPDPQSGHAPRQLTGAKFALLRNEFATDVPVTPKRIFGQTRRLLVTFGGQDIENLNLRTLKLLSNLKKPQLVVDCVVSSVYPHLEELAALKSNSNLHLRVHRNVDRMSQLMQHVDMAITGVGAVCYELVRCGVPTIVIPISNDQKRMAGSLAKSGAIVSVKLDPQTQLLTPNALDQRLKKSLKQLMNDRAARHQMSRKGMKLIDGQGANRIARWITGQCYQLRAAESGDAKLLWNWRNDPEVRSVSFRQSNLSFDSHRHWLRNQLEQLDTQMWVAEDQTGRPVGQVQLELSNPQTAFISLVVDQARRGRGLGTVLIETALKSAFEQLPVDQVVAQFKPKNVAAETAFRNAGFHTLPPTTINGELANQLVFKRNWLLEEPSRVPQLKKSA